MKIAIAGAGAMGCRFGAMLHESGEQVVLVDGWSEHVKAIQTQGLVLMHESGTSTCAIQSTMDAAEVGLADLVIIFTKAMYTAKVVEGALPMIGSHTQVMTLQNGLGNIEAIASYVPQERIIAGVTNFGTELVAPGRIRALGSGETSIMNVHGRPTDELLGICDVMNAAGLNARIEPNVLALIWEKVAFNCVYNPLAALTRLRALDIGGYENFDDIVNGVLNEIVTVAKAEGAAIHEGKIRATIQSVLDPAMSGEHLTSMLQDVLAKRQTEIAYLNGAIAQRAKKHGIAVPYNRLLCHLIRMLETTYERQVNSIYA